jgi:hypothetical protein
MPDSGASPLPQDLQFQHAEPIAPADSAPKIGPECVVCHRATGENYFHAQGQIVCPSCADQIRNIQQKPPASALLKAALYGGAAAFGGFLIYVLVAVLFNLEIGIIAILVGWMVGKAIRHASHGLGGRPQQILAVALTYFAISTSYIPVMVYHYTKSPKGQQSLQAERQKQNQPDDQRGSVTADGSARRPAMGALLFAILTLAAIGPFLVLKASFVSGLISLFILFIGMQRAWRMTGRPEISLTGPYAVDAQ